MAEPCRSLNPTKCIDGTPQNVSNFSVICLEKIESRIPSIQQLKVGHSEWNSQFITNNM